MAKNSLMAGASRFAHLAGLSRKSRAEDDDQREDARRADDDDDDTSAEEDTPENGDDGSTDSGGLKKGKKSKRAEDDDPDDDEDQPKGKRSKKASEEDDDDEEEPKARGKKSKRAEDDDPDDEDDDKQEMSGRSAVAAARRRERARCAAIFATPAAAHNPALAADLAFNTTMTRGEAVKVMRGQATLATGSGSASRASLNPRLGPGGAVSGGSHAVASSWDNAFAKVGGRRG